LEASGTAGGVALPLLAGAVAVAEDIGSDEAVGLAGVTGADEVVVGLADVTGADEVVGLAEAVGVVEVLFDGTNSASTK
jgi:hypothetical protein